MGRDYYNTLGITKSASTADVQKAYVPKNRLSQLGYFILLIAIEG